MSNHAFNPYILLINHISDEWQKPGESFALRYTIYHKPDIVTGDPGHAALMDTGMSLSQIPDYLWSPIFKQYSRNIRAFHR